MPVQAAGLRFGMLSAEEVGAAFSRLRPPRGSAALYTPLGGMVQGRLAAAVLAAMAARAGADVAPAGRPRGLLGWRDAGGHFALRCGPAAAGAAEESGAETIWEVEQLVLLPEAAAARQCFAAFGLAAPGVQLLRVPAARWQAQEDCTSLPVWQLLGTGGSRAVDDPTAVDSCWGTPVLGWAPGGLLVAQSLADGEAAGRPAERGSSQGEAGSAGGGGSLAASALLEAASSGGIETAAAAAAAAAAAGLEERPQSEEAIERQLAQLAEAQQRKEAAERRLETAGGLAARLVNGVGARLAAPARLALQLLATPDGEPAAGSHPGFERGRVVAAFPAAAAAPGALPGDQLAPLVARLAVAELEGQPPEAVNAAAVAFDRVALGAEARPLHFDSWTELGRCLEDAGVSQ